MRKTPNYNMNLPDGSDYYNVEQFNENTTITDTTMHNLQATLAATVSEIQEMRQTFRAGVDACYDACVTKGSTPASYALRDVVDAINNIESGGIVIPKSITQNGTYLAQEDNANGYSSVTVNVPVSDAYYVEPQATRLEPIESGTTRTILWIYFTLAQAERVRFRSTLNYTITLIAGSSSANVTLRYYWDIDGVSDPVTATYNSDGSQILTVDYLLPELAVGDHVFCVDIGITGGDIE